jgi:hypothetical protein
MIDNRSIDGCDGMGCDGIGSDQIRLDYVHMYIYIYVRACVLYLTHAFILYIYICLMI